jgi:hypothetical protein
MAMAERALQDRVRERHLDAGRLHRLPRSRQ